MKKIILVVFALVVVAVLCTAFYFLGSMKAVQKMSFKRVTPNQIADAMQQDHFYSDFGHKTLIVKGKVASVTKNGGSNRVTLETTSSYHAYCDLSKESKVPPTGSKVKLLAEGGAALRQSNAVLLVGCTTP